MGAKSSQGGKGNKKKGRNQAYCDAYKREHKHEMSHIRRAWKHVCRYGTTDHMAVHYLNNADILLKRKLGVPDSITPTTRA